MNRIEATLAGWSAPTPEQSALKSEFMRHSHEVTAADLREGRPDHVTASALVVSDDGVGVLLALHRRVGRWLQFGGHVEPSDATLAAAALREACEESGLVDLGLRSEDPVQLDRHPAPCSPTARYHLDVQFVAKVTGRPAPIISDESLDVRWFDRDALPDLTDDSVRSLVAGAAR